MRNLFVTLVTAFYCFSLFSQTPLPVDQNTIALWNFDQDTADVVTDIGPNNIQGTSINASLGQIPGLTLLSNARFFKDQTSFLAFGPLSQNSPLDLASLNEWTIEFVTWWDRRPTGPRVIFDNGQVSIKMIDFKFAAAINKNGTSYGVMTRNLTAGAVPYRVAINYKNDELSIIVNGKVRGTTRIPLKRTKSKAIYGQPVRIGGTPSQKIESFKIGRNHACLTTENGDMKCWGNNSHYQLGDRTNNFYFMPVDVEGLKNISKISIAENFTCAIKDSTPYCWGQDNFFSLGTDYQGPYRAIPLAVPTVTGSLDISSGRNHTCTLQADKTVKCWGKNEQGQIGMGSYFPAGYPFTSNISDVKEVVAGGEHVCALKEDGTVWCWGDNSRGQLGQMTFVHQTSANPLQVQIDSVTKITAGMNHTCAVKNDGFVFCWGANDLGQLGSGNTNDSSDPVLVLNLGQAISVSSGYGNHSCATTSSGVMSCWGQNDRSQVGLPPAQPFSNVPVTINAFPVSDISVGGRTNCYQKFDKSLYCFGSNSFGLLGDGSIVASTIFPSVVLATEQSHFPGYIDDIRISDVARFQISTPDLSLVSSDHVSEVRPNFEISFQSQHAIDSTTLFVTLNNIAASGLSYSNGSISGQLNKDLLFGENILEVSVNDIQGNLASKKFKIYYNSELDPALPIKVVTKNNTSCYLTGEGSVWCWGSNLHAQLGNEERKFSSNPVKNPYFKNIVDIAVSADTICALDRNRDVLCLGDNTYGKLGRVDPSAYRSFPISIGFDFPIKKLVAGFNTFCILQDSGAANCWGENAFSTYTSGFNSYDYPFPINDISNVDDIAIGRHHMCYLNNLKELWCRGYNNLGQVGDGGTSPSVSLRKVELPNVIKVSAGYTNTCAITEDRKLYCWGQNNYKQLGAGPNSTNYQYSLPQETLVTTNVRDVQVGESFVCAINDDYSVGCWGQNTHGEMGNGQLSRDFTYYQIPDLQFIQLSSSGNTSCGITTDHKIFCWGANTIGQAGNSLGSYTLVPVEVIPHASSSNNLTDILAGQANSCMRNNGEVYCWGNNEQEQIGTTSGNFSELYPVKVTGMENAKQTSIGYGLICHTTVGNQVACAGFNNFGQAGQNYSQYQRVSPAMIVPNLNDVKEVKSGLDFSCALKNDGTVWCWGRNSFGQLGSEVNRFSQTHIPQIIDSTWSFQKLYISSRGYYACALTTLGGVVCWGDNSSGQFADTSETSIFKPMFGAFSLNPKNMALGAYFACVHRSDNKISCRGTNQEGQLGIGTDNWSLDPIAFKEDITHISAGEKHSCALDVKGDVYCWGRNVEGQLGNGMNTNSFYPVKVLSNVKEISSGSEHSCAITLNNKLACWGFNGNGQFGNGTTASSTTPIFSDLTKK